MKVQLKTLKLQNFRSVHNAELIFNSSGMLLLNGPSGAGKSTINLAVAYALGFCSVAQNQLQRWNSKDPMFVDLTLEIDNQSFWIHRGTDFVGCSGPGEYFALNGAKNVNSRINTLFKIDPEMLGALTYRAQQEPGAFIRKTDAEKKEFLTRVLRLDKFESVVETTNQAIKDYTTNLEKSKIEVEHLIKLVAESKANLIEPPNQSEIDEAQQLLGLYRIQESKLKYRLENTQDNSENPEILEKRRLHKESLKYLDQAIAEDEIKNSQFQLEKRKKQELLNIYRDKLNQFNQTKRRIQELSSFEFKKCYTCHQEIKDQNLLNKFSAEMVRLRDAPVQFTDKESVDISLLEKDILEPFTPSPTIDKLRRISSKLLSELEDCKKSASQDAINLKREEIELQQNINKTIKYLDSTLIVKKQADKTKQYLATKQQELTEARKQLNIIKGKLDVEQELLNVVGNQGFLGVIFEEILQEISITTNQILSNVPNTANVTIDFKTESITQKGTIKKSIIPLVTVGGNSGYFDAILSGGMKTMVMLAVDLAISKIVARRAGIELSWMVLDEPVDGADVESRAAIYELLSRESLNRLIIIVDHSIITQGLFTDQISVKLTPEGTIYQRYKTN